MHGFEMQRFAMQFWSRSRGIALKFPRKYCCVVFVVAERFPIRRLVFFAEMCAAGFIAFQSVCAHQLSEFQKICDASGAFEGLVKIFIVPWDPHIVPELFA